MRKILTIGKRTEDPELRGTPSNVNVCDFTIEVNKRHSAGLTDISNGDILF